MHITDSPIITDWFTVSIRWMFLLASVISLSIGGKCTCPVKYSPASGNLKLWSETYANSCRLTLFFAWRGQRTETCSGANSWCWCRSFILASGSAAPAGQSGNYARFTRPWQNGRAGPPVHWRLRARCNRFYRRVWTFPGRVYRSCNGRCNCPDSCARFPWPGCRDGIDLNWCMFTHSIFGNRKCFQPIYAPASRQKFTRNVVWLPTLGKSEQYYLQTPDWNPAATPIGWLAGLRPVQSGRSSRRYPQPLPGCLWNPR